MEQSILTSIKKNLGLDASYTVFDPDITIYINAAFSTLTQLGIGPAAGFMIESADDNWDDFIVLDDDRQYNPIKTYITLRVRMLFDPPQTSYLLDAMTAQINQLEWRLNVHREETGWVDPDPPALPEPV